MPGTPDDALLQALASRFTVTRTLGRGGMGTVYLANDRDLGRDVAIKVLNADVSSAVGMERFTHEIRLTARLVHPNIVPLFDSGEAAGRLYYVMPHIDGESLRTVLERSGSLPLPQALRIVSDVSEALAYAHALGTVHRDVKPENIFWYRGRALLADFGVALGAERGNQRVTQAGLVVGSPRYLSPEQAEGLLEVDGRADLYSLGCVAFELLTGRPPYAGESTMALLTAHLVHPVPSAQELRAEVPVLLDALLRRLMSKEPEDRPPTGAALLEELRPLEAGLVAGSTPPGTTVVQRSPPSAQLPPDAAELHAKARQLFAAALQGGATSTEKVAMARAYVERALQQVPNHALLLATQADLMHLAGVRGLGEPEDYMERARALRYRALALDDSLGQVHSAIGVDLLYWQDDFALAGEELRRGVELDPEHAEGRRYYGAWLKIAGRPEEALLQMRAAVRLAPHAPFMHVGEADILMTLGRYDEAVGSLRNALRLLPRYEAALERLEMACHRAGRHDEALDARRVMLGLRKDGVRLKELWEGTERDGWLAAREHDLRLELGELLARADREDPFVDRGTSRQLSDQVILVLAELGEWRQAMDWVERGYHRRPGRLRRVLMDLPYDSHGLASDPRYARLLRTAGMEELMG